MARWTINAPLDEGESDDVLASAKAAPSPKSRAREAVARYDGQLLAAERRIAQLEAGRAESNLGFNDLLNRACDLERQVNETTAALARRTHECAGLRAELDSLRDALHEYASRETALRRSLPRRIVARLRRLRTRARNGPGLLGSRAWPKIHPPLTAEQQAISDDFMSYWLDLVGKGPIYRLFDKFNHGYPVRRAPKSFLTTLEIGAGSGSHLGYENLDDNQRAAYVALEIRENLLAELRRKHPDVDARLGDCQEYIPFEDGHFDRIVATHVLEHLPRLPDAAREMYRVCNKDNGRLSIVIPCEGSLANNFARAISSARVFKKRYGQPFTWFIESEHLSFADEVFEALDPYFEVVDRRFFPIPVPLSFMNFCIGATFRPRAAVAP